MSRPMVGRSDIFSVHDGVRDPTRAQRRYLRSMPPIVRLLLQIDLLLALLHAGSFVLFRFVLPPSVKVAGPDAKSAEYTFKWLSALFDLNSEANVPTWYASVQLLLVAVLLALFAHAKFDRRHLTASLGLVAAAAMFALLSLDEVASLHENFGGKLVHYLRAQNGNSAVILSAFWTLVLIPFLIAVVCIARCAWHHLRSHPLFVRQFGVGLLVYLAFGVGCELLWITVVASDPAGSLFEIMLEETGEMLGVTLMVWAAWDVLARERISFAFMTPAADKPVSAR